MTNHEEIRELTKKRLERFHLGGWIVGGVLLGGLLYAQAGTKAALGAVPLTLAVCYSLHEKHQQDWQLWDAGNYAALLSNEERQFYGLTEQQQLEPPLSTPTPPNSLPLAGQQDEWLQPPKPTSVAPAKGDAVEQQQPSIADSTLRSRSQHGQIFPDIKDDHPQLSKPASVAPAKVDGEDIDWGEIVHSPEPAAVVAAPMPSVQSVSVTIPHQVWQPKAVEATDLAASLAARLQSTMVVGQPGAGKGVLIANAIREIKKQRPEVQIWVVDPKCDPTEKWYWEPADKYLGIKIRPFTDDEEMMQNCATITDFMRQFELLPGSKLLIIDEVLCLKEKAPKWFTGFLMPGFNAVCSMGRSSAQYGWLVSQSPNTADFGCSGGVRNVYRRILLIHESNKGLLYNGSTFFSGKPAEKLYGATGRVFYDSATNSWGAVPNYPMPAQPADRWQSFSDWLTTKAGQTITLRQIIQLWGNKQKPSIAAIDGVLPFVETAIEKRLLEESTPEGDRSKGHGNRRFIVAKT